jgi:heme oxygenase
LNQLNRETRDHHAEADAPWLALMAVNVRRGDYARQLEIAYGFEAPLEGAFAYTEGLAAIVDVRSRARAGLIAQDLLALGVAPSRLTRLPQCFAITPFEHITEALGWMYVVERATLLHDSLRHSLLRRLPDARRASTYLAAASSVAGARWQRFGRALDKHSSDAGARGIAAAAHRAFRRWRAWVEHNQREEQSAG